MWPVELLKTVFWMASSDWRVFVAEAHANGVRAAVGDERIGGGDAIENGGGVFGDFRAA